MQRAVVPSLSVRYGAAAAVVEPRAGRPAVRRVRRVLCATARGRGRPGERGKAVRRRRLGVAVCMAVCVPVPVPLALALSPAVVVVVAVVVAAVVRGAALAVAGCAPARFQRTAARLRTRRLLAALALVTGVRDRVRRPFGARQAPQRAAC
jgi:hypothetical protein